jgi:hypothetical protein
MPIKGLMRKIDRAKVHLDALSQAVESWRKTQTDCLFFQDDIERGEHIIEFRPPISDKDVEMALIAGDFVCCLRASLDHLAWQLAASANPGTVPSKRIAFPIIGENTLDTQIAFTKMTFGIPEEAVYTIRSLQPYHGGDAYRHKFLWILNTLWNIDKHRSIAMHSLVTEIRLHVSSAMPIRCDRFDDHMKMVFNLTDKSNIKFQPMPPPEVNFGDEKEGVKVTVEGLRTIYEAVRNEIIPAFAGFFPQSKGIGD